MMPTLLLVVVAMLAFAANSVLCRMALGEAAIDAASFTSLRLGSGAISLAVILWWRGRRTKSKQTVSIDPLASAMLFSYAVCFSFAYLKLSTASGALILFGTVQLTMVIAGLVQGERPRPVVWLGMSIAFAGLVYLVLPGVTAPSPGGALLMSLSGLAWGIYSLRGKQSTDPVNSTAWNFITTLPITLICSLAFWPDIHVSLSGFILAVISGAFASALGYIIWYTVLPSLTPSRAATVQLSVPVLAGIAGTVILDELFSSRLAIASIAVLGGIGFTIMAKKRPRKVTAPLTRL